jgi:Rrf2 family transcriptional regulator, nitric oxide-sensitive transcriptional repressor
MRLATFTDHSLRVLISVALAPGGRTTIAEVARQLELAENHVVKVVHALGRLGFLANARGRGGGLRLAAPAASINVGRVVAATEDWDMVECFDRERNTCSLAGRCRLEGVLHDAMDAFHDVLGRYTLADLASTRPPVATRVLRLVARGSGETPA